MKNKKVIEIKELLEKIDKEFYEEINKLIEEDTKNEE